MTIHCFSESYPILMRTLALAKFPSRNWSRPLSDRLAIFWPHPWRLWAGCCHCYLISFLRRLLGRCVLVSWGQLYWRYYWYHQCIVFLARFATKLLLSYVIDFKQDKWGGRRGLNPWIWLRLILSDGWKVHRASLFVFLNTHWESLTHIHCPKNCPTTLIIVCEQCLVIAQIFLGFGWQHTH